MIRDASYDYDKENDSIRKADIAPRSHLSSRRARGQSVKSQSYLEKASCGSVEAAKPQEVFGYAPKE